MSAVAAAVVAGSATLIGADLQYSATQNAANSQSQAVDRTNQQQLSQWQQEQANMAPYLASGTQNLATLNSDMPDLTRQFTAQDFQSSPGYQFQLNQGLQAMQRSASANGTLDSVGTQQNLNNYAQGMANTDYQQALQNFTNSQQQRYSMLYGMANMGLSATGMSNQAGQNFANQTGQNTMGAANATAAAGIGSANAISGGVSNAANGYMSYSMMNNLMNNQNQNPSFNSGLNVGAYSPQSGFGGTGVGAQPQYGLGVNTDLTSALAE